MTLKSTFTESGRIYHPKMESITYKLIVDSPESGRRLELLHDNVKKYGTVFNTVFAGTELSGTLIRKN